MNLFTTIILWSWLLGIALVVPASLPAGGAQASVIQNRKNNSRSPIIALKELNLLSSASYDSSVVARIKEGTPVNILKVWDSSDTGKWLLVNVLIQEYCQPFYKRGWVYIHNS